MDFVFPIAGEGLCSVPESMIARAHDTLVKCLDGKYKRLTELENHVEFEVKEIRLVQIAWLFKNRKIDYAFLDDKKERLAMGIRR